jgi:hypothetical protein
MKEINWHEKIELSRALLDYLTGRPLELGPVPQRQGSCPPEPSLGGHVVPSSTTPLVAAKPTTTNAKHCSHRAVAFWYSDTYDAAANLVEAAMQYSPEERANFLRDAYRGAEVQLADANVRVQRKP